jgi:hypothetical protein
MLEKEDVRSEQKIGTSTDIKKNWYENEIEEIISLPVDVVRLYRVPFTEESMTLNGPPGARWERCGAAEKERKKFLDAAKRMHPFDFIQTKVREEVQEGRNPRSKVVREGNKVLLEVRVTKIGRRRLENDRLASA